MSSYKIAFFLPHLESKGGVTVAVQTITRHLSSLGHNVHLFPIGKTSHPATAHIHPVHATKRREQIKLTQILFANEEKKDLFDLVVSNTMPTNEIVHHLNIQNRQLIVLHQASLFTKKNLFTLLKRRLTFPKLFNGKHIAMVSNCLEKEFLNKYPYLKPRSTQTIYNALDIKHIEDLSKQPADLPNEAYILTLGRQTKNKNISMLLYALKEMQNKNVNLVLLGHGKETKRLKTLTKTLRLESRVRFIIWESNPYPWIKHAKVLVSTSKSETLSMVLLEGLSLNTPVISTDIKCGPSEILTKELSNFLIPLNDTSALADKIDEALLHYPKIKPQHTQLFELDRIAQRYITHIQTIQNEG